MKEAPRKHGSALTRTFPSNRAFEGCARAIMSDTTEAADPRLRQPPATREAVLRLLEEGAESEGPRLLLDFAEIFLSRVPDQILRERSAEELGAMARDAFAFLEQTRPYRVNVAVGNPGPEAGGWGAEITAIRTNVTERPFIIDTIREYLNACDLDIELMVYPLFDVQRDEGGRITALLPPSDGGPKESVVHCEVARVTDPDQITLIQAELTRRLQDVVRATDDFRPMLGAVERVIIQLDQRAEDIPRRREELEEIQHFLRWLVEGGFVFLGYRAYDLIGAKANERSIVVQPGSGLGLLRNEAESRFAEPVPISELEGGMRDLAVHGPVLIINKTNAESTVHRRARMDYIGVKKLDVGGNVVGEHRFIGLFTSKAYAQAADNIPILRHKLAGILEEAGARAGSHDYKEIITIFNSLPKEELFLSSAAEVAQDVRTALTSYSSSEVRVSLRKDPLHRGLSVMVILPKERFSGTVRRAIEAALVEAYQAEVLNYHLAMGEGNQARLHFYIGGKEAQIEAVQASELETVIGELIRTWTDRIMEGLESVRPAEEARRLARHYGNVLSREYQAATEPDIAVGDIVELEAMRAEGRTISISLANREEAVGFPEATELKVFLRGERLILSDFMPILENAGLRVIAMKPHEVGGNGDPDATIYIFGVQDAEGARLDVAECGERLSETVLAARAGDAVSDRLNALVVTAGLRWREVDVLRGYAGYAFQVGAVPSRQALPSALVRHPGLARELFDLFETKFDPSGSMTVAQRLSAAADIRSAFHASLGGVSLLSEDRALRRLEELISSTVRTNYYRRGGSDNPSRSGGVPYISYKFLVGDQEEARPTELLFEVWVHSSRMEGVHLRGSEVARGGIRWSDRPDDFRTEILGLVKTQMVKNAVIVPGGSKGGFVTRHIPSDAEARLEEGKLQYQTLMRGLLDVTDNLVDGRPKPPENVFCYDRPDPYLVVAADKGTATFSDVANDVSGEYGFWLGDAFASGGSNGYDHKTVGITARGAWECVKRHFLEMGKDIQSEPLTVVGIGDMSGDVFGNGMLLSEQIRLIAAFDHRHVFIDPDPDPATSFAERSRLFALGRSSWGDYDRGVLSEGGMIVPRGAKEVELSPQARRALGLYGEDPVDGESLIRCVLRAPVELLWNGGIGTYVKASTETNADAGDPANDPVRIDVPELRCEVVGEGGNLGLTQRARVEYALLGGRLNTDALDNSGGVDMSDHEVNLKILLAPSVSAGSMSDERRNQLLGELTEAVAELVLEDNRSQSLGISLDERRAKEAMDDFRDLMFALEKSGDLDRAAECLPSLDVLVERRDRGQWIVRPELCVLLAYAKLGLKTQLLKSSLPEDPVTESYLLGYFPPTAIVAAGRDNLTRHRLRHEIITAQLTNDLVDLMGATFVNRIMRDTGRSAEEVVRSWLVASRLADHRALLRQMGQQRTAVNVRVSYRWLMGLARVLERTTRWVLQNVEPEEASTRIVDQNLAGLALLRDTFTEFVAGEERQLFEARVREIRELGADEAFSRRLITLRFLDQLLEILDISRETTTEPIPTAHAYYQAAETLDVPWLRRRIFAAAGDDQWEIRAAQVLSEDLSRAHRRLVVGVLKGFELAGNGVPPDSDYMGGLKARDLGRFREIVTELKDEESIGLAAISVATRELSDLADRVAPAQEVRW
jgi:glutamate dehydrogenase